MEKTLKNIAEINQHLRDGINEWADIMLLADADALRTFLVSSMLSL